MRPFKPEHYYRAALERIGQAHALYKHGASFALAMYAAGLAVECLLRAFKGRHDPTFDERHDLLRLFKASRIWETEQKPGSHADEARTLAYRRELHAGLNVLVALGSNDYRFASEERLRSHLRNQVELRKGIRGDILKENARHLIDTASLFLERGMYLWKRSFAK